MPLDNTTNDVVEPIDNSTNDDVVEAPLDVERHNDEEPLNDEDPVVLENRWVKVNSKKDLPKVNTMVECKFPDQSFTVKCKVLSRAGKSLALPECPRR